MEYKGKVKNLYSKHTALALKNRWGFMTKNVKKGSGKEEAEKKYSKKKRGRREVPRSFGQVRL